MVPLMSSTIYLLVIALSGVAARAVDTNITSLPTTNISSSMLANSSNVTTSLTPSNSSNVTSSSQSCNDINSCRTLDQIVVSCLVTILACVWFAVHPNIPEPRPKPYQHPRAIYKVIGRAAQRFQYYLIKQREAAMVVVVALLAPEWILAWAVRQGIVAYKLCMTLRGIERDKGRSADEANDCWTWSHGFFIAMGGLLFYDKDEPLYPLSPTEAVELVRRGHLVLPTAGEISNQSKGDAMSKGVAIAQTLWFVAQCIARRLAHLPLTSLEVITLAYTVMTVAMYIAWWAKPLNVSCAVRVPQQEIEKDYVEECETIGDLLGAYVMGDQDKYVDLHKETLVPTFWAGNGEEATLWIADAIALSVAMMFGAVHCIAWNSEFRTPIEQQMWRACAIAITAFPVTFIIAFFPSLLISMIFDSGEVGMLLAYILYTIVAILYAAARLALITLSFRSLIALPFDAYLTVQWTCKYLFDNRM